MNKLFKKLRMTKGKQYNTIYKNTPEIISGVYNIKILRFAQNDI